MIDLESRPPGADPFKPGDPLPVVAPTRRRYSPLGPRNSPLAMALTAIVVMAPALSVAEAGWVAGIGMVGWLAAGGLLVGLAFGRVRLPALVLHLVGCLAGEMVALWAVSSTLPGATFDARLLVLAQRFATWLDVVRRGGTATDNLLFLLAVAIAAWFIGYTGAYAALRQGSPWWPIFAGGTAMLVNAAYRGHTDPYLPIFLLASLLLLVRLTLAAHERVWRATGLEYPRGLATSATGFGGLLAAGVLALAFLTPSAAAAQMAVERLRELREGKPPLQAVEQAKSEVERLFGGVPAQGRDSENGFGGGLTLQSEFRGGQEIVAEVQAARGRYWRAITYQDYTGRGWTTGGGNVRQALAPDVPHPSAYTSRVELPQRVRVRAPRGDALLAAGQPRAVGLAATAESPPGLTGDPIALDLAATLRAPRLSSGLEYAVSSAVSVADEGALRQAGADYPAAIVQRFGSQPEVPARVRELARRIAPPDMTPYERARAVERYLRANYRYDLKVPAPPIGRDGADFFLFDSKTGYCDYFATAMTVLMRSAGVPARVASGYAVGEQDPATGRWLVRDANAHSWVEVYFPRYGWIEFEPSPIRPEAVRGGSNGPAGQVLPPSLATPTPRPQTPLVHDPAEAAPGASSDGAAARAPDSSGSPLWLVLALGAGAVLTVIGATRIGWGWGIDGLPESEAGYARMARLARLLGRGPAPEQTPHEFGQALAARAPAASGSIAELVESFTRARFAHPADRGSGTSGHLAAAWQQVRAALLRSVVRR